MVDSKRRSYAYLCAFIVTVFDQITKIVARTNLEYQSPLEIVGNFVRFTFAWNEGAAFSLSWGGPWVLGIFTGIAVIALFIYIWKCSDCNRMVSIALGAILGGAVGNLIDRCIFGKVVDFIDIGLSGWRWPTFNVADIAISLGGVLLLIVFARKKDKEKERKNVTG